MSVVLPISILSFLGFALALGLALAYRRLRVEVDPRLEKVAEALPGANCGGCGYPGCRSLAEAIVGGRESPASCPVGGEDTVARIAGILGVEAKPVVKRIARVHCRGSRSVVRPRGVYQGLPECRPAHLLGGNKQCRFGCLGQGDCERACPFEAIAMDPDGLPKVFEDRCTGCGMCIEACPRNILELHPAGQRVLVFCRSTDRGPVSRRACDNACIGCGICVRDFPDAVVMENTLARVVADDRIPEERMSDLDKCPTKAIARFGRSS